MKVLRLVFFPVLKTSKRTHPKKAKIKVIKKCTGKSYRSAGAFCVNILSTKSHRLAGVAVNTAVSSILMCSLPHDRTHAWPYARTIGAIWINFVLFPTATLWAASPNEKLQRRNSYMKYRRDNRIAELIVNYDNKSKKERRERERERKAIIVRLISHVRERVFVCYASFIVPWQ